MPAKTEKYRHQLHCCVFVSRVLMREIVWKHTFGDYQYRNAVKYIRTDNNHTGSSHLSLETPRQSSQEIH